MPTPKTTTIYLTDGEDPTGTKYAFVAGRTLRGYFIPRKKFSDVKIAEIEGPALYFLFGDNRVYIGESETACARILRHSLDADKDFWNESLIFISTGQQGAFDLTAIKYLEHLAISEAKKADKYELENKNDKKKPFAQEHQVATYKDCFEDIKLLCSFLNYPVFDKKRKDGLFFCKYLGGKVDARGVYENQGFVVHSGSKINLESTPTLGKASTNNRTYGVDEKEEVTEDRNFKTPSGAAEFCLGRPANGWTEWANEKGETLDKVYRQGKK